MTQSISRQQEQPQGKMMLVEQPVYTCNYAGCTRAFKTKFALKRHRLVHTQARDCVCPFCGKTFSLPQYMREHTYTHTREKPYVCGVAGCQARFRQAGKLSLHRRTHEEYNVKKYNFLLNPKAKRLYRARPSPEASEDPPPRADPDLSLKAPLGNDADINRRPCLEPSPRAEESEKIHDTHEGVPSTEPDHVTTSLALAAHFTKTKADLASGVDLLPSINLFFTPQMGAAALHKSGGEAMTVKQCSVPDHLTHYILPMDKCLPWLTLPYRPLFRPVLPLPVESLHHPSSSNEHSWTK
jgi:hypothetical protein